MVVFNCRSSRTRLEGRSERGNRRAQGSNNAGSSDIEWAKPAPSAPKEAGAAASVRYNRVLTIQSD